MTLSLSPQFRQSAGRTKTRYVNEQVIELFDKDLVALPRELPPWFQRHLAYAVSRRQAASLPAFVALTRCLPAGDCVPADRRGRGRSWSAARS